MRCDPPTRPSRRQGTPDFAARASTAPGSEVETIMRAQGERILGSMDLVQREEFEAVKEMATKAREENAQLSERIAKLEALLAQAGKTA